MGQREIPGSTEFGFGMRNSLGFLIFGVLVILVCIGGVAAMIVGTVYYFILEGTGEQQILGVAIIAGVIAVAAYSIGPLMPVLAWIPRAIFEMRHQCVRATADGILLDDTRAECYRWSEIDRFIVGEVEVDGECNSTVGAVMLLHNGQRIYLHALERNSMRPHNAGHVAQITERVTRLNGLLERARAAASP
jgi:hypothetical protein